jgi:hypothetical protein
MTAILWNLCVAVRCCVFLVEHNTCFIIRNIRQNIKLMESREMLEQVHVASVGDVEDQRVK